MPVCNRCQKEAPKLQRLMEIIFVMPIDDASERRPPPFVVELYNQQVHLCVICIKAGGTDELIETVKGTAPVPKAYEFVDLRWRV